MIFFSTSLFEFPRVFFQIALGKPLETIWVFVYLVTVGEKSWQKTQDYIDVINNMSAPKVPRSGEMGVSKNGGFSPQIIHFNKVFHYKPSILGYPFFWKHPDGKRNFCFCLVFFALGGGSVLLGISREFGGQSHSEIWETVSQGFFCVIYIYNHDIYIYRF